MSPRTQEIAAALHDDAVRNKAQAEHAAEDDEPKKFVDTADLADRETWAHPTGHSGTRRAWALSISMLASFLLGGIGLTFGPRPLLWIGVALFAALAVLSLVLRAWTDYAREKRRESEH